MHLRRKDELKSTTGARPPRCLLTALLILTGCQAGEHDRAFALHLQKLANVFSGQAVVDVTGERRGADSAGFDPVDISAGAYDELDILDLRGCALQRTLIRQQSPLGKTAKPSQRLLLTLEYLRHAPDCAVLLRQQGDSALANSLETAWEARRRDLPAYIFSATLGGAEYRALWTADPALMGFPPVGQSTVVSALSAIDRLSSRWLAGDYRSHNGDFELLLSEVAGGRGGALLQSLHSQAEALDGLDRLFLKRLHRDPRCNAPSNRREFVRLVAAAGRAFHTDVLPGITESSGRIAQLLAPLAALETRLGDVLPATYLHWRTLRDQKIGAARTAPLKHLALLARLTNACAHS